MAEPTGPIADHASGELPEEWKQLGNNANGAPYGDSFLQRKIDSVMRRYLGDVISVDEQQELHELVLDYFGKRVALSLITPGIDFWSKQVVSAAATGRNENKTWAANRSADLRELRKYLLAEVSDAWLDVEPLLPVLPGARSSAVPTVLSEADRTDPDYSPDPNAMEPVYDRTREGEVTGQVGGTGGGGA